jgi:archaemetzincin
MTVIRRLFFMLLLGAAPACSDGGHPEDRADVQSLLTAMEKLRPLHTKLGEPRPGDWLEEHDEPGQSFREYLASDPILPRDRRRVIYIQPLGEFTETQRKIVTLTAEFTERYFNLPVKVREDVPLSVIPASARRRHPSWGMEQILTGYVLDRLLRPQLPDDAAACIALTTSDLWPGEGWNFVFGQASIRNRVGVWSIYRNGDPHESEVSFRLCLVRTLKTATHEIGHMFSMLHCTAYQCNMCGSNHREESDRRPLALCPECLAKVCWATQSDPLDRYRKLAAFSKGHGLEAEHAFYERAIGALDAP